MSDILQMTRMHDHQLGARLAVAHFSRATAGRAGNVSAKPQLTGLQNRTEAERARSFSHLIS